MKDGKLEQSDVGKRFRKSWWVEPTYGILIGFTSSELPVFELQNGKLTSDFNESWSPYELHEQPKKKNRIEAAPAVFEGSTGDKFISLNEFFYSEQQARHYLGRKFLKWPADFDPVKGVWFYEWSIDGAP